MKILEIDYDYYYYPDGITCIKDFIDYANKHYSSFIELKQFQTENCVFPYLIKEDTTKVYINIANLNKIQEVEATVLYRFEYNVRLEQIVEMKCTDCIHYFISFVMASFWRRYFSNWSERQGEIFCLPGNFFDLS